MTTPPPMSSFTAFMMPGGRPRNPWGGCGCVAAPHDAACKVRAAWDAVCESEDGRAVAAVCAAAVGGLTLGGDYIDKLAADAGLEYKLRAAFKDTDFLPVLLAATRYYRGGTDRQRGGWRCCGGCRRRRRQVLLIAAAWLSCVLAP